MPEKSLDQIAYEKYLSEVGDAPIDEKVAAREQGVLANAKSREYKSRTYEDPTREDVLKGMPEGELSKTEFKTDMSEDELSKAIEELTWARKIFVKYLDDARPMLGFAKPEKTSLLDIEDTLSEFPQEVGDAVSVMAKYNVPGEIVLFDLPEELQDTINDYSVALKHMKNKDTK